MDRFKKLFRYKILPIYWAFLTYILLRPSRIERDDLWLNFAHMDKVVHLCAFAVLGFCYRVAFSKQRLYVFVGIMLLYAFLTEVFQEVLGWGRTMEELDFLADALGIGLGYIFWYNRQNQK